jgi:hypothetical protein
LAFESGDAARDIGSILGDVCWGGGVKAGSKCRSSEAGDEGDGGEGV